VAICINKNLIGSESHLVYDGSTFSWKSLIPKDSWLCGFSERHVRSIDIISEALGDKIQTSPGENYEKAWSTVRPDGLTNIPLSKALQRDVFQAYIERLVDQSWNLLASCQGKYHTKEFLTIRSFLLGLGQCKIDIKSLYKVLDSESENGSSLRSFIPDSSGFIPKVMYSQISSCSGRLTVKSGPSILTLRKDRRKFFRSAKHNGNIVQVDFVSLEPRVALSLSKNYPKGDVYEKIRRDVLDSSVTRDVAKIATIGSLYGMSASRMSSVISVEDISLCKTILKKIREYFKIPDIEKSLKKESKISGKILSHYGKEMSVDQEPGHILVNRFIQSTSSDAAILGFSLFREMISKAEIDASPVFVIHDALILDVCGEDVEKLKLLTSEFSALPGLEGSFPLSFEIIS